MEEDRIVSPEMMEGQSEERLENTLRPKEKKRAIRPCFIIWSSRAWKNNII